MSNIIVKVVVVIFIVAALSGASLAAINGKAQPLIIKNKEAETAKAVLEVLPRAKTFDKETVDGMAIFKGKDAQGADAGLAFIAIGNGWGSVLTMMVGVDPVNKKITGLKVIDQRETPGLGDLITKPKFQDQFKDLSYEPEVKYVKNVEPDEPNEIQAITGATISSRSVTGIINRELAKALKATGNE